MSMQHHKEVIIMKQLNNYESPEIMLIKLDARDIITVSGDGETPILPDLDW